MRLNPEIEKWIFLSEKCFNKAVRFAQIDLINTGSKGNSVSVTLAEGTSQKIDTPKGSGFTVRKIPHQSYFTAIIHGKGHLKVLLKSQNVGKGKPTSVLFKSLCVNGKNLLKGKKEVFSDKYLEFDLPVYDGAKLFFEINYKATNGSYDMLKEGTDFFKLKIKDKAVLYIRSLI